MNIFFDYKIFTLQVFGGISRYIIELSRSLNKKSVNNQILSPIYLNQLLHEKKNELNVKGIFLKKFPKYTNKIINFITKNYTNYYLSSFKSEIVHFTYFCEKFYLSRKNKKNHRTFLTVYDLIHEKFSQYYKSSFIIDKKSYLENVNHIICISQNTKKDLINYYEIPEEKISVVYLGVDHKIFNSNLENSMNFQHDNKPYILYVGERKRYKNFERFIKAYSHSSKLNNNFDIICFGGENVSFSEKNLLINLKLSNKVKYMFGNDKLLLSLYKSARLYVCPSLYEGFGLTIIEAMAANCPVACSIGSSIDEISKDNAVKFDPNSIDSIIFEIEKVIFDDSKLDFFRKKGNKYSKEFTWDKCAENTLAVYNKFK